MSVTMSSPSGPAASPIMAKFFSSSQPMAPAPTCQGRDAAVHCIPSWMLSSLPVPWSLPTHHQVLLVAQILLEISPEDGNLAIVARASLPGQGAV